MGEQPRPVEDEVERALSSMRASFLSGSEQIATGIASLEEHFASAPEAERAAVATAITHLVATHERLTSKVADLPPSSWDSFKVIVGAVKAQQAVLDQVSNLVQQHVLPRQLESLQATPFPAASLDDNPPRPVSASYIPDDVGGFPGHDRNYADDAPRPVSASYIPDDVGGFPGHDRDYGGDAPRPVSASYIPDDVGGFPGHDRDYADDAPRPVSASYIPDDVGGFPGQDRDSAENPPRPVSASFIPDDVGGFAGPDRDFGDAPLFSGSSPGRDNQRGDDPSPFSGGGMPSRAGPRGNNRVVDDGFHGDSGFRGAGGVRSPPHPGFGAGVHPAGAAHAGAQRGKAQAGVHGRRKLSGFRALAEAGLRRADDDGEDTEQRSLLAVVRERMAGFSGLAAMAVVGVILSLFPRDMQLREIAAKLIEVVEPGGQVTVAEAPPSRPAAAAAEPRSMDRVPSAPESEAVADGERVAASPPPERTAVDAPQRFTVAASRREAPDQPRTRRIAAAVPVEEQFVPVVFTHKDKETVQRAMTDLKAQYPNVLIGRRGEIVSIDLGKKGIWHRLRVLPAGSRPEATKLCDELADEGYDRCWVSSLRRRK